MRRAAGDEEKISCRAQRPSWFVLVRTIFPSRIFLDRVDDHLAPHAVAARDLHGKTGKRHQRIHERRVSLTPDERVHAAHRGAHHQPQMIDAQPLRDQRVLRGDHVVVIVVRKLRAQPVARLRGLSVTDPVGQNDIGMRGIE